MAFVSPWTGAEVVEALKPLPSLLISLAWHPDSHPRWGQRSQDASVSPSSSSFSSFDKREGAISMGLAGEEEHSCLVAG